MLSNLEDRAWLTRYRLFGDEKAFGKLVDKYKQRIVRFFLMQTGGNQDDSYDLAQETFIKAWRSINSLEHMQTFSAWLFRIAYNVWIDRMRIVSHTECYAEPPYENCQSTISPIEKDEQRQQLNAALARLNNQERTCLILFYLQEMSIREIEAITHFSAGTIKSHLSRGREKMRKMTNLKDI